MPHTYDYNKNDGKIHTRYSELNNCKPHLMERVLLNREDKVPGFESPEMYFGTVRHEMMQKESESTGRFPLVIRSKIKSFENIKLDIFEKEFHAEIFDGVVLHACPDTVSLEAKMIFDYKTATRSEKPKNHAKKYLSTMQLDVYAYMLSLHGVEITEAVYLAEIWDKERKTFYGYDYASKKIDAAALDNARDWLRQRCEVLIAAIKLRKEENEKHNVSV